MYKDFLRLLTKAMTTHRTKMGSRALIVFGRQTVEVNFRQFNESHPNYLVMQEPEEWLYLDTSEVVE